MNFGATNSKPGAQKISSKKEQSKPQINGMQMDGIFFLKKIKKEQSYDKKEVKLNNRTVRIFQYEEF